MSYEKLSTFINDPRRMNMQHIYQPVMLMTLLQQGGRCPEHEIAKSILAHDQSQIEYYANRVRDMVGRVLREHRLVARDRASKVWSLNGYEALSPGEIQELINACQDRLNAFISDRGDRVFEHRKRSRGAVSGTIRYEVFKRARFRCELCGTIDEEKALEVDHIVPRNLGGSDDISNLQALCFTCNAMKRDRDDTDFRGIHESYSYRVDSCVFCDISKDRIIDSNALAYVVRDAYPVTDLHTLIIPRRHVQSYFDLGQPEINATTELLKNAQAAIEQQDSSVEAFNVGINDGETSGQTIPHCHIHLIPRRVGDVKDPRGGIRHTIPGRGSY